MLPEPPSPEPSAHTYGDDDLLEVPKVGGPSGTPGLEFDYDDVCGFLAVLFLY